MADTRVDFARDCRVQVSRDTRDHDVEPTLVLLQQRRTDTDTDRAATGTFGIKTTYVEPPSCTPGDEEDGEEWAGLRWLWQGDEAGLLRLVDARTELTLSPAYDRVHWGCFYDAVGYWITAARTEGGHAALPCHVAPPQQYPSDWSGGRCTLLHNAYVATHRQGDVSFNACIW